MPFWPSASFFFPSFARLLLYENVRPAAMNSAGAFNQINRLRQMSSTVSPFSSLFFCVCRHRRPADSLSLNVG